MVKSRPDTPGEPIRVDSGSPSRWVDSVKAVKGRRVVGDRMHGKVRHVKEGDLPGTRLVFIALKQGTKSQPGRSQSTRSSVDAG